MKSLSHLIKPRNAFRSMTNDTESKYYQRPQSFQWKIAYDRLASFKFFIIPLMLKSVNCKTRSSME